MKVRITTVANSRRTAIHDDNLDTEKPKISDSSVSIKGMDGIYKAMVQQLRGDIYAPAIERKAALDREVKHLLYCIKNSTHSKTDGFVGLGVVQILAAAHE